MKNYDNIYFLGIGGIGMSAIARYFLHQGKSVAGYDRTSTPLTRQLEEEGAEIRYQDTEDAIPEAYRDPESTLVVYTPAIPSDHCGFNWFSHNGFNTVKRSRMLGYISQGKYVMAVAGTHGKTTTSTLLAWLNHCAAAPKSDINDGGGAGTGSAFLGGISKNFGSNLVLGTGKRLAVEADEFDRSFLQLHPDAAVITSTDADHLDIYGTHESLKEAFTEFAGQIKQGGTVILNHSANLDISLPGRAIYTYSLDGETDFHAENIQLEEGGHYIFDIICPDRSIPSCTLGVPGLINVENAVAATALMWVAGFDEMKLREALASFSGVKRRFEFHINTPGLIYMDDYAHHPRELTAAISSVKKMFPGKRMTAVFQPHLYSRTNDFYNEFAKALSLADKVILLPIYPARELPIEGVSSELIARNITTPVEIVEKSELANKLGSMDHELVVTFGAGDIDALVSEIKDKLTSANR